MSATAEALVEQFKALPNVEQQQVIREILKPTLSLPETSSSLFPTVRVPGGTITSEQVAEALDE
jgi:hypothetical protein